MTSAAGCPFGPAGWGRGTSLLLEGISHAGMAPRATCLSNQLDRGRRAGVRIWLSGCAPPHWLGDLISPVCRPAREAWPWKKLALRGQLGLPRPGPSWDQRAPHPQLAPLKQLKGTWNQRHAPSLPEARPCCAGCWAVRYLCERVLSNRGHSSALSLARFEKAQQREELGVTLGTEYLFGYNYLQFNTYVYFYFCSSSF